MLFNSLEFIWLFLPITLAGFFLLGRFGLYRGAVIWLVLASWVFYGYWNPVYLLLLWASIAFNYYWGQLLSRQHARRRLWLGLGVGANLATLGYFKYVNFLVDTINYLPGVDIEVAQVVLPLAISFFTLQQIAYLVDTYQRKTEEHSFPHYCLFVSFFPQLIAGPIVHHKEVLPQFARSNIYHPQLGNLVDGGTIFMLGLFKKVVIADQLSLYAVPVFDASAEGTMLTFFEAWSGVLAYTFQLYFDFSGYADMAIGLAMMFGIRLPQNFNSPYRARSIIEFWRRWHITLTTFLRDYLFIPLAVGGKRRSKAHSYFILFLTMVVGGVWHGAGWTFFIWGCLHGTLLAINHVWRSLVLRMPMAKTWSGQQYLGWALTFFAVTVSMVPFRAADLGATGLLLESMAGLHGVQLPQQVISSLPFLGLIAAPAPVLPFLGGGTLLGLVELSGMLSIAAFIALAMPNLHEMTPRRRMWLLIPCIGFLVQALFFGRAPSEFLYFQF